MTDEFVLSIENGTPTPDEYTARLLLQGFGHKFKVMIGNVEVFFEPDEQGSYRVVKMPWQDEKGLQKIDAGLLENIQQKLVEILAD